MTARRIVVIVFALIIAAAVVAGFRVLGTPAHQRDIAVDHLETSRMRSVANSVNARRGPYPRPVNVPKFLPAPYVNPMNQLTLKPPMVDYRRVDSTHFELCGTFREASEPLEPAYEHDYAHPAGHVCFQYDATVVPIHPVLMNNASR